MVILGGMLGTAARAQLEGAFAPPAGGWPWVTFAINLVGSFVLGALLEALSRTGRDVGWRRAARVGLGTGVIGGFTTYSTFIVETALLVRDGHVGTGVVYAVATFALATNRRWLAWPTVLVEMAGVLVVGTLSFVDPGRFLRATVWSWFGAEYLLVPLVLPFLGVAWLRRSGRAPVDAADAGEGPGDGPAGAADRPVG